MFTKIGIVGLLSATAVGIGTGAAVSSSNAPSPSPSTSPSSNSPAKTHARNGGLKRLLKNTEHGQLVTKGKDGASVTHDLIHGTVSAVSANSITVLAADKVSQTYTISSDTKVRMRATRSLGSIGSVKKGDEVFVLGTGTSTFAAKRVLDLG